MAAAEDVNSRCSGETRSKCVFTRFCRHTSKSCHCESMHAVLKNRSHTKSVAPPLFVAIFYTFVPLHLCENESKMSRKRMQIAVTQKVALSSHTLHLVTPRRASRKGYHTLPPFVRAKFIFYLLRARSRFLLDSLATFLALGLIIVCVKRDNSLLFCSVYKVVSKSNSEDVAVHLNQLRIFIGTPLCINKWHNFLRCLTAFIISRKQTPTFYFKKH